ncbi:ATP-grasp domain-containing protein [Paramaledivibacter caminithermalis]|uniref:ATP-grasp domain-containing protein n=1 Tax=Paramaledivibacter caminithermalis (strain DSM 15212 / CIP 107654 / DViRD3) TaxID=1121301 RepID=A0A1M6QH48_PARC5|nr:ATP-grasp domain-containing protein [Paramaledivibacter caminithermalis]SHK19367.1 ATP-grasp domain-containing protein [Paramaledivibacter caminithermalis DSM 15212]
MRKNILFLGTGTYKKNIFKHVGAKNNIYLLTNKTPTWENDFICDYRIIDTFNKLDTLKSAMELESLYGIDGAMIIAEPYVEVAGVIFDALGFPGVSEEVSRNCRNKFEMKKCFINHGVPVAEGFQVHTKDEFIRAALKMDNSFIVKPIASWGSYGVKRVRNKSKKYLEKIYNEIIEHTYRMNKSTVLLVEEYLDGKELSVEALVYDGEVFPLAINDKPTPLEGPYFFDLDYVINFENSQEEEKEIFEITKKALKALGIQNGAAHLEMRCTSRGYKVLEAACRLGGGSIPDAVEKAVGVNMYEQYMNIALGIKPQISKHKLMCAGVRIIYRYKEGIIKAINNVEEVCMWDGIEDISIRVKPGYKIILPPKNYKISLGYIFATGNSLRGVTDLLKRADEKISFQI